MKFARSLVSLAGLAQLAAAIPLSSSSSVPSSSSIPSSSSVPSPSSTPGAFASTSGLEFTIDGKTGYFAGSNAYWLSFLTSDEDVEKVLSHFVKSGLKVLRVWGFSDVNETPTDGKVWFQKHADGKSTINTGKDGLQRLDAVVNGAEKHGVKLIVNFVNFWEDYGGMASYMKAYGGADKSKFFTTKKVQAAYRKYVEAVVSRYKNSKAIFAWELANEPRCSGCDTSVMHDWIADTSKYIKSLDSRHMVCIGDEGFGLDIQSDKSYPYQYSEGSDFAKNLAIPTIDFGTFHLYPDSWGTTNAWGNGWVSSHGAACKAAGKPCLFEEYGVTSNHCKLEKPWQQTALNTTAMAGDLFWQFGDTLSSGKSPNDGNTLYYGSEEYKCLVTDHVAEIGR